ncbi:ubiquitin carboxyl-terminal hydrolase 47-like [Culicoides brevitarsis]|uniref:ubiquitin carboxyl-terminal hydrolase 47-like n=1 Tax=Culicoides brevitarsis TaxID=469753 RepID=UPI00307BB9E3
MKRKCEFAEETCKRRKTMVSHDEGSTVCIVLDCMPNSQQKRQSMIVRPSYRVVDFLEDIKRQYQYDAFVLKLKVTKNAEPIVLNNHKGKTLQEVGLKFTQTDRNILIIDKPGSENSDSEVSIAVKKKKKPEAMNLTSVNGVNGDEKTEEVKTKEKSVTSSPEENNEEVPFDFDPNWPALPLFDAPSSNNSNDTEEKKDGIVSQFRKMKSLDRPHFVGLVNQAMTCYLNSLLQALFMTPEFRNALYNWEFDGTGESKSIPFQLQKLFLNLQTSTKSAVETTDLTRSFGWDSTEAWQQHDIQELCRVMFDALEQKFKNTKQADLINQLYEGKMTDYVKCLECSTEKSREDTFLDIPLPVKPFGSSIAYNSVEEALRAFVQPETLDGNNQYHCETCNKKCDAHKGLKFTKFPYILTLHLKRFDFDYQTMHRIKLNDKVTFPQTLNLNGFVNQTDICSQPIASDNMSIGHESVESAMKCDDCSTTDSGSALDDDGTMSAGQSTTAAGQDPADLQEDDEGIDMNGDGKSTSSTPNESGPYLYELFSIMIHSGSASGGHYYAYIKDFESGQWFSFNDQTVSPITQEDIQKSFGGAGYKAFLSAYSSSTNAYMLMYRQIDPPRNAKFIKESEFGEHIKTLKMTLKEKEENDRSYSRSFTQSSSVLGDLLKIKIFFYHPKQQKLVDGNIYISQESTLEDALEEAHRKHGKSFGTIDLFRLVAYESVTETIDRSFEGREKDTINDIMTSLKGNNNELLLEMRKPDEEFDVYLPGGIITKVYSVDLQTADIDGPVQIRGLLNGTVMDYKKAIAKKLHMNAASLVVAKINATGGIQTSGNEFNCSIAKVLDDDNVTLNEEQLHLSHKIFVAQTNAVGEDANQRMKKIVERFEHIITIYFILPNTDKENLDKLQIPVYNPTQTPTIENNNDFLSSNSLKTPTACKTAPSFDTVDAMCYVNPSPVPTHVNNANAQHPPTSSNELTASGDYRRISPLPSLEPTECNSEDSSLSDSDRTLVDAAQDDLSHISSTSNSPACSDPHLSSPDDYCNNSDTDVDMNSSAAQLEMQIERGKASYFRATPFEEIDTDSEFETTRKMLKALVDRSMTIGALKYHLQPYLGVPHTHFKVLLTNSREQEITKLNDTLSSFKDGERLKIELGRALQKGEYKCKILYLNLKEIDDDTEKLPLICEWILREDTEVGPVFNEMLAYINKIDPKYAHLNTSNCWLRKKSCKCPSKVLLPDQKFGEDMLLLPCGNEVIIEEIFEGYPKFEDPDDTIIFARRWNPSTRTLGEFQEVVIPRENGELFNVLSTLSGIPEENLEYTKITNSFPRCNVSLMSIPSLVWYSSTPSSYDRSTMNDGTLVFYQDKTEPLKELTNEEREQMMNKTVNDLNTSSRYTSSYSPKKERALKIQIDWSPKKRDD